MSWRSQRVPMSIAIVVIIVLCPLAGVGLYAVLAELQRRIP